MYISTLFLLLFFLFPNIDYSFWTCTRGH